jgi:hypothetical protein
MLILRDPANSLELPEAFVVETFFNDTATTEIYTDE